MAQKEAAGKLTIPYEFLVHRPRSERRPAARWQRVAVEVEGVADSEDAFVEALRLALALRPTVDGEGRHAGLDPLGP